MKSLATLLMIFLFSLSLVSCGQKETTSANLVVKIASLKSSAFDGSLLIMGKNLKTGANFLKRVDSRGFSQDLPNGVWAFAVMGWHGASSDFSQNKNFRGIAYCDIIKKIELEGGEVDLNFSATRSGCENKFFGENTYNRNYGFLPLEGHACYSIDRFIKEDGSFPIDHIGVCNNSAPSIKTNATHFSLSITTLNLDGSIGESVQGGCIPMNNSSIPNGSSISSLKPEEYFRVPKGSKDFNFQYIMKTSSNSECSDNKEYVFTRSLNRKSIKENIAGSVYRPSSEDADGSGTIDRNIVLFNENYCSATTSSRRNLPINSNVEFICTENDFPTSSTSSQSYILGKDIVLSNTDGSAYFVDDFTSNFYGNHYILQEGNKALFNKIKADSTFSSSTPQVIQDITLRDFVISSTSTSNIGLMANDAEVDSSSALNIQNIKLERSRTSLDAEHINSTSTLSSIGSLVGSISNENDFTATSNQGTTQYTSALTLKRITSNINLNGNHDIGGLIGDISGKAQITESGFYGRISSGSDADNLGGIIGSISKRDNVDSGFKFDLIASKPLTLNNSSSSTVKIGGFIGNIADPSSNSSLVYKLTDSYFIAPNNFNSNISGIFGRITGGGNITSNNFDGVYVGGRINASSTYYSISEESSSQGGNTLSDLNLGAFNIFYNSSNSNYQILNGPNIGNNDLTNISIDSDRFTKANLYTLSRDRTGEISDSWVTSTNLIGNDEVKLKWELGLP